MAYRFVRYAGVACLVAAWQGCDETAPSPQPADSGVEAGAIERDVTLQFEARVGDEPFDCNKSYTGLGTTKIAASFEDNRLYVYDVMLVNDRGEKIPVLLPDDDRFQSQNVALLDFEDDTGTCSNGSKETNTTLHGKVADGNYTGLSFRLGMPEALSHANPATLKAPLNLTKLSWGWKLGHLFMVVEVAPTAPAPDGSTRGFQVHVGADDCLGGPCSRQNRVAVELDEFDVDNDKIVFDLAKLVARSALDMPSGKGADGCATEHDDPDCMPVFEQLGLDLASGEPAATTQVVFSAEAR